MHAHFLCVHLPLNLLWSTSNIGFSIASIVLLVLLIKARSFDYCFVIVLWLQINSYFGEQYVLLSDY